MIQSVVKRSRQDNVEVVVVCKEEKFDVYIDIYPGVVVSTKVRNSYFGFKLKLLNGKEKLEEPIHFELKNRKYNKGYSSQHFRYEFKNKGYYYFKISLTPSIYVSDEKLKDDKERIKEKRKRKGRAKAKELNKMLSTQNICKPGLKTSNKTTYTKNNASHPFQGGRCTPK